MAAKKATRKKNEPALEPSFVFKGTVKKLKSATMKDISVNARTAIVRVDQVLEAPANLKNYSGTDITVEFAGKKKMSAGDTYIFHTHGWIFGDSIAVRSIKQEPITQSHSALLASATNPVERRATRLTQQRIDKADLIVSGKVAAVTVPPGTEEVTRAAGVPAGPVSEHDPKWRQAVISIGEVHKGTHDSNQVKILFPASTDVRWYKAPKFHAGQQGTFVLHKTPIKPAEHHELRGLAVTGMPGEETEVYTALDPADYHPIQEQPRIKAMIR
jgi:hypothetical protein